MSEQFPGARFADAQQRYRLEGRIATGGMGEVWRATDTALGRPVAVKLLKAEYADDPTFRSRFETEARHAARLHHPGVAAVYDVGEAPSDDGSGNPRPFLIMELVDGQPLSALLRGGRPLDPQVTRDLMAQAADAIGAAHAAGIVHRDVKPANLLVTPDRQVKITDFGIARASDGLGLTGTGQVMGTPQYLSPEQARGTTATPASDVYSLGVVAFECLAGHRPFDAESPVATALAHLNDPVPDLPPGTPTDLAAIVRRCLSKRPEERYADGAALAAAFRGDPSAVAPTQVVATPPVERTQVMGVPPVGFGSSTYDPTPTPVTPVPAPVPVSYDDDDRRRSPWPIVLLVLALVAVIGLIGYLLLSQGDDGDTDPTAGATSETTSAPPTPSETPSETQSEEPTPTETEPDTFDIDEDDYIGRPVDAVQEALENRGLDVDLQEVDNPGDEDAGDVVSVSPTQDLEEGATVTVEYWGDPPETESPTPTPTPTPTESTGPAGPGSGGPGSGGPGNGNGPGGEGPPGQGQAGGRP